MKLLGFGAIPIEVDAAAGTAKTVLIGLRKRESIHGVERALANLG